MGGCADYLAWLEHNPPVEGHLSLRHGFLNPEPALEELPDGHRVWDDAARALPELFFSNCTRSVLEGLPMLSTDEDSLPEAALGRASIVLSALAHAYWRFGAQTFFTDRITRVPGSLPPVILQPWQGVSRRLGRFMPERPFQSFYDLLLSNYRLRPEARTREPKIENIQPLVPSFGNEAERVFYGAFVEMHWRLSPMVASICALEESLALDDVDRALDELQTLVSCLQSASSVWSKIGSVPSARNQCDPVLWSKTVAILGVPPAACPQGGTSGACAPALYVLDALLGRDRYDSYYGQYVATTASRMVPDSIHGFARCTASIELRRQVEARAGTPSGSRLAEATNALADAYAGPTGWLGRHASKAFSYLCVSTITGRNASVSGHERYFDKRTWERATDHLDESRRERIESIATPNATPNAMPTPPAQCPMRGIADRTPSGGETASRAPGASGTVRAEPRAPNPTRGCPVSHARGHGAGPGELVGAPVISRVELTRHVAPDDCWVAIDGVVYDLSQYANRHPGGRAILQAYAGQDVTSPFRQQSGHQGSGVPRILARLAIGRLQPSVEARHRGRGPGGSLEQYLLALVRGRQAVTLAYEHAMGGDPRMKLFSDEHAHRQMWRDILKNAFDTLSPGLTARLTRSENARLVLSRTQALSSNYDFRGRLSPRLDRAMSKRSSSLASHDRALLDALLEQARRAIEAGEMHDGSSALLPPPSGASRPAPANWRGLSERCRRTRLLSEISWQVGQYFYAVVRDWLVVERTLCQTTVQRDLPLDLQRLSAAG